MQISPTTPQIPFNIYQISSTYKLGIPTAEYKPAVTSPVAIVLIALGVILVDVILMVIVSALGFISCLLLVIPIIAIAAACSFIANRHLRVYLFPAGFIRAKGEQVDAVRWDQIDSVWQKSTRRRSGSTAHTYTIRRADGKMFKFDNILKGIDVLGKTIQHEVTRRQLPKAFAAFSSGGNVFFGPLCLNTSGVSNGREFLPWNLVKQIQVEKGYVLITRHDSRANWVRLGASDVPNILVFMSLADHVLENRRDSAAQR